MAWPDAINAVPVAPSGTLGGTTPTHRGLHDLARTALIEIRDKVNVVGEMDREYALSDETTAITSTGNPKITVRMPWGLALSEVRASLTTASSSGAVTVDINLEGTSILSTKLTIDQGEKTSVTAATPAVISTTDLWDDAEISFDVDGAGTGAKGLKVKLIGVRDDSITQPGSGPSFVAETHTTYASRTTTTVTKPTGTIDGDLVILIALAGAAGEAPDITPPTGFTIWPGGYPIDMTDGSFNVELYIYHKVASSEPASWDFTNTTASTQGAALTYRNIDTVTPLDVSPSGNTGTGETSVANSITTVTNGAMTLWISTDWGSTTNPLSVPSGGSVTLTERIDSAGGPGLIYVADGILATAGTTGTPSQTNNNNVSSSDRWAVVRAALRPA